ncbi:hypothetical protein B0T14DRAFT_563820 [Immersiella caudata]|uniref:Dienelactone hydrolase domain-containing protein n=1 Tax=Immersiella caudata TaxID=314043 RepID=A0AA39WVW0_9PEZI|nr:hypothetical protein B0T14DRAFT_563820 [Immersiella caudata]
MPYSRAGYLTLPLDILSGDPFPLHKAFAILSPTDDITQDWVTRGTGGKSPHGIPQIGPIYLVRFLDEGKGKIDVGFGAHPTYVSEELWKSRGALSIAAAGERDLIFTVELRRQTEEILKKKGEVWSIALYSGVAHGFAVRGYPERKEDKWAMNEAFWQAARFFGTWL